MSAGLVTMDEVEDFYLNLLAYARDLSGGNEHDLGEVIKFGEVLCKELQERGISPTMAIPAMAMTIAATIRASCQMHGAEFHPERKVAGLLADLAGAEVGAVNTRGKAQA